MTIRKFYDMEHDFYIGGVESKSSVKSEMTNEQISRKLNSIKLCLQAHPDNQPDSEFEDRISDIEDIEQQLSAERERAGNLVDVFQKLAWHLDRLKQYDLVEVIKQALNDYNQ